MQVLNSSRPCGTSFELKGGVILFKTACSAPSFSPCFTSCKLYGLLSSDVWSWLSCSGLFASIL